MCKITTQKGRDRPRDDGRPVPRTDLKGAVQSEAPSYEAAGKQSYNGKKKKKVADSRPVRGGDKTTATADPGVISSNGGEGKRKEKLAKMKTPRPNLASVR